jgi:hypothetical protein
LRHLANKKEKELIETLTPSPSLFSMFLLWGKTTDLQQRAFPKLVVQTQRSRSIL